MAKPGVVHVEGVWQSFPNCSYKPTFFHFEYRGLKFRIEPNRGRWDVSRKSYMRYTSVYKRNRLMTFETPRKAFYYVKMMFGDR